MAIASPNIKSFYKGQTIFKEGQESNVAYMIRKGRVNIFKNINNKKVILAHLKEGEIFGEMGVITKAPRTADAEAVEYCDLMVLTEQLFKKLLGQCPKTIQYMTKLLIHRLQKTDQLIPEGTSKSTFLSVCRILDMEYRNHLNMPKDEQRREPNYNMGIPMNRFAKTVKEIILISQLELEDILNKLAKLKIITLGSLKTSKAFTERFISINDPKNFLSVSESLYKELQRTDFSATTELAFVDIFEFAEHVDAEPRIVYKKMANMEVPETLFFFHKSQAFAWADEQEQGFFNKVKRRRKNVEDFEDVNDVVYLDNATLKDALGRIGYHKVGVLLAVAEEDARKKLLANLAKKVARAVEDEIRHVDETEAEDVQDEFLALVREIKGVAA